MAKLRVDKIVKHNAVWHEHLVEDIGDIFDTLDSRYAKLDLTNQPFKSAVNSTTAFQIQQADATPVFNVDTVNGKLDFNDGKSGTDERGILFSHGGTNVNNLFLGSNSGNMAMTGSNNVGLGGNTLAANTTGQDNVALGRNSMYRNTSGGTNIALGTNSLFINTTGYQNVAIGQSALYLNTEGYRNVAIGAYALQNNTANYNVAIGGSSLFNNTTANYNVGIGANALYSNTTGGSNIAIGAYALEHTTGSYSIGIGYQSLRQITTGLRNVGIGGFSGYKITTGHYNFAIGYNALHECVDGTYNMAFGGNALYTNISGHRNVAIGDSALQHATGNDSIGIGYQALQDVSTGYGHIAIGNYAGRNITTSTYNTAIGYSSLATCTTGVRNVAIGGFALYTHNEHYTIAIGYRALYTNTDGVNNVAIGSLALEDNTGSYSTAIGTYALRNATSGGYNIGIGFEAGNDLTTGASNIFIGYRSGYKQTTNSNLLIVDNQLRASAAVELTNSILYGVMASTPASQTLRINAGLTVSQETLLLDKLKFTQTDGNEYIDSLADGYMDYRATTAHRFGDGTNYTEIKSDGIIELHGDARATKCFYIPADGIKAPGAKPATFILSGLSGAWEFTDAIEVNQESISGNTKIPCDADTTIAPTLNVGWYANGASPGDVKWQLEYLYVGENDDMTAAAQETLTVVDTASSTSNGMTIATFTGIDLPSTGKQAMLWKLTRLSADTDDTISASVLLRGMFFSYTANKLGNG